MSITTGFDTRPPNLLVVISDQHPFRMLGCAGDPAVRTPHLDRLIGDTVLNLRLAKR